MTVDYAANLSTLATYLEALPPDYAHFDMADYWGLTPPVNSVAPDECGTVACAAGHAPAALGITAAMLTDLGLLSRDGIRWNRFIDLFLLAHPDHGDDVPSMSFREQRPDWAWMFSDRWAAYDNTPAGAAARIRYYLIAGVPPEFLGRGAYHEEFAIGHAIYTTAVAA